jgi:hypothetical protein
MCEIVMTISLYLHEEYINILRCFGNIDEAIDRLLEECEIGNIELMDHDAAPSREGAMRINVNVTNEYYLDLYYKFGSNSKRISLRRLIYWFIDNAVYDSLQWNTTSEYVNSKKEKYRRKINDACSILTKVKKDLPTKDRELLEIALSYIEKIKGG